jgi:hypothetical protein
MEGFYDLCIAVQTISAFLTLGEMPVCISIQGKNATISTSSSPAPFTVVVFGIIPFGLQGECAVIDPVDFMDRGVFVTIMENPICFHREGVAAKAVQIGGGGVFLEVPAFGEFGFLSLDGESEEEG